MNKATLSYGFLLNVTFYCPTSYRTDVVVAALNSAISSGLEPTTASLYDVAPGETSPADLYKGTPHLIEQDFSRKAGREWARSLVFASCEFVIRKGSLYCEARLRSKFHEDGTFGLSLDLPYTAIFEEGGLDLTQMVKASSLIESIGLAMFRSSAYLYGGIMVEEDAPSLKDLEEGRSILPADFGFFSHAVVNLLGREELLRLLKPARKRQEIARGGLSFIWSELWEDFPDTEAASEFREFVQRQSPRVSTLRRPRSHLP